jgi:hypothetical protein
MDKNGFPDPKQLDELVLPEGEASAAMAEAYVAAVDSVFALMRDARTLNEHDEDIAWATFANRLQYPAHYRLSKRQMAELLSAAVSILLDATATATLAAGTRPPT